MIDPEIQAAISDVLPQFEFGDNPATYAHIDDTTVTIISQILSWRGDEDSSRRPRIYILLHYLGLTRYNTAFSGHSDDYLPYVDWTLPENLDESARQTFLKWQDLLIPPERRLFGPKVKPHMDFKDERGCRLRSVKVLGHGAWGVVECVRGEISQRIFARKKFFFKGRNSDVRRVLESFKRELQALKRLQHLHLVTYVGSYADPSGTSLMMLPVAECDLSTWMQERSDGAAIQQFFGCLASALAFLHQEKVRHKDIKPSNILVYRRRVLLSDFGSSLDWKEWGKSTTSGNAEVGTRVYAAPESFEHGRRGSSSDIFSLGCVFLELATKLCGFLYDDLYQHLKENGTCVAFYRDNEYGIRLWVEKLKRLHQTATKFKLLEVILRMLDTDNRLRPRAPEIANDIMSLGEEFSCHQCRIDSVVRELDAMNIFVQEPKQRGPALCKAARQGDVAIFQLILGITDDLDAKAAAFAYAIQCNHLPIVESYLRHCKSGALEPDMDLALSRAVQVGDEHVVDLLMKFGADPNAAREADPTWRSPLYMAVTCGDEPIVRKMISHGADLNRKEAYHGETILHAAVRGPSGTSVLNLILAQKPDVDVIDVEGNTPLMEASNFAGSLQIVNALLEPGANPNIPDNAGSSPVNRAYNSGNHDVVRALISANADPHDPCWTFILAFAGATSMLKEILKGSEGQRLPRDGLRRTLLHLVIESQCESTVTMILERASPADLLCRTVQRCTPLHYAAGRPSISILQILLSQPRVPTTLRDSDGNTPLCLAVRKGISLESVRLLIKQNYEAIDIESKSGDTPLGHACKRDEFFAFAAVLIENGADIRFAAKPSGNTPLHIAATYESKKIVQLLLDNGADMEAENSSGETPLHLAASQGSLSSLELLLRRGALINAQDKKGYTAIGLAAINDQVASLECLIRRGDASIDQFVAGSTELMHASARGNLKAVSSLLGCGAEINMKDDKQESALFKAISKKKTDVAIFLMENGAGAGEGNSVDITPLLLAASLECTEIAKELIDRGVSLDTQNSVGSTALSVAAHRGNIELIGLLLDAGANIENRDKDGWTPLFRTAHQGHKEAAILLVDRGANIHETEEIAETCDFDNDLSTRQILRETKKYFMEGNNSSKGSLGAFTWGSKRNGWPTDLEVMVRSTATGGKDSSPSSTGAAIF